MRRLLPFALLACASLAVAETQTWQIDPNHTASQFSVRHLGISTVRGQFMKQTVFTVGHSTHELDRFVRLEVSREFFFELFRGRPGRSGRGAIVRNSAHRRTFS